MLHFMCYSLVVVIILFTFPILFVYAFLFKRISLMHLFCWSVREPPLRFIYKYHYILFSNQLFLSLSLLIPFSCLSFYFLASWIETFIFFFLFNKSILEAWIFLLIAVVFIDINLQVCNCDFSHRNNSIFILISVYILMIFKVHTHHNKHN